VMAAMDAQAQSEKTPAVSAPMTCPSYPGTVALLSTPVQSLAGSSRPCDEMRKFEFVQVAEQSSPLSRPAQTHAGRGPPAANLS